MKRPVTLMRNAAGVYVATKMSERFVKRTRKKFSGTLVTAAVVGVAIYTGVAITGAVFGAALGATWWVLTLPFTHPIYTAIAVGGGYLWLKAKKLLG